MVHKTFYKNTIIKVVYIGKDKQTGEKIHTSVPIKLSEDVIINHVVAIKIVSTDEENTFIYEIDDNFNVFNTNESSQLRSDLNSWATANGDKSVINACVFAQLFNYWTWNLNQKKVVDTYFLKQIHDIYTNNTSIVNNVFYPVEYIHYKDIYRIFSNMNNERFFCFKQNSFENKTTSEYFLNLLAPFIILMDEAIENNFTSLNHMIAFMVYTECEGVICQILNIFQLQNHQSPNYYWSNYNAAKYDHAKNIERFNIYGVEICEL